MAEWDPYTTPIITEVGGKVRAEDLPDYIERLAGRYLDQRDGDWQPISWAEAADRVDAYANGLLSLGIRKGDAFAIFARNHVEWALFDFALGSIGAICAPSL